MVSGERQDRQRTPGTRAWRGVEKPALRGLGLRPQSRERDAAVAPAAGLGGFCYHSPSRRILTVTTLLQLRMSVSEHNKPEDYLVNTFNYMVIIIQFLLFNILYKTSYNTHDISNATIHIELHRYAKFTRHYEALS